jgi:hypothetical protein
VKNTGDLGNPYLIDGTVVFSVGSGGALVVVGVNRAEAEVWEAVLGREEEQGLAGWQGRPRYGGKLMRADEDQEGRGFAALHVLVLAAAQCPGEGRKWCWCWCWC